MHRRRTPGSRSIFYRSPFLYRALIRLLYGKSYRSRFDAIARFIDRGSRVVDLCAGDCAIYFLCLRDKNVSYRAYDISPEFIRHAVRRGVDATHADVRTLPIPDCDVILLMDSLYQFPDAFPQLIERASLAAPTLMVLEPVSNMTSNRIRCLRKLAEVLTDFGEGPVSFRFDRTSLYELWKRHEVDDVVDLGRDMLGIWRFRP